MCSSLLEVEEEVARATGHPEAVVQAASSAIPQFPSPQAPRFRLLLAAAVLAASRLELLRRRQQALFP